MRPLRDMLRDGTAPGAARWGRGGVGDALLSEVARGSQVVAIRNFRVNYEVAGNWGFQNFRFQV